jgi:hypothetical protein
MTSCPARCAKDIAASARSAASGCWVGVDDAPPADVVGVEVVGADAVVVGDAAVLGEEESAGAPVHAATAASRAAPAATRVERT